MLKKNNNPEDKNSTAAKTDFVENKVFEGNNKNPVENIFKKLTFRKV